MEKLKEILAEVHKTLGEDAPVYAVGGCVRDTFLKKEPKDYDFATPLSPDEVENRVKAAGRHASPRGKRFGTIGFKVRTGNAWRLVEVTTFRRESYTPGSRKPAVEFVTELQEDLARRDLTINAIAFGPDGTVYDPFGGRLDILEKKIKAVGDPKDRFKEDPLRLLRAARFAAQLGFEIDPNLIGKARRVAYTIQDVSRERWVDEMDKLLMAPDPIRGLDALEDMHVLKFMIPELKVMSVPDLLGEDVDTNWGILLSEIGRPATAVQDDDGYDIKFPRHELVGAEMARGIALRLKWSNDRREHVVEQVRRHQCQP